MTALPSSTFTGRSSIGQHWPIRRTATLLNLFLKKRIFKICRKRRAMAMTEAVSLAAAARSRIRSIGRRGAARLVAWAGDEKLSPWLVAGFCLLPVGVWALILTRLGAGAG